ncbi:MAG: transcription termination factor Rho [Clostridia bacterium]|nr:transcription termination factor Rho [Clostridia bacterium]
MANTTENELSRYGIFDLRKLLRDLGGTPGTKSKKELISDIINIQNGEIPVRNKRGRKAVAGRVANGFETPESDYEENRFEAPSAVQGESRQSEAAVPRYPAAEDAARKSRPAPQFEKKEKLQDSETDGRSDTVSGVLEVHADGYGFLRARNYETSTNGDTFVSRQAVRGYWLRRGDFVVGYAERTRETGSSSLTEVLSVNGLAPRTERRNFDDLVPCYPNERLTLENGGGDYTMRIMDLLCPLGKGQRGLVVAPPKTGKTTLLKKVAQAIEKNHPSAHLIVLLIDERPEEVTDLKRSVKGEVVYSTFDEPAEHHIRAAELVMWRAKRLVELGKDVVILLDSITRLTRAYNQAVPSSGKILSGGIDPAALQAPKKFFGAARNIEDGGSLTVLATALIETGSKMDDVIYEEFKGTGNMEIHLTRELSERRIFPAIDLYGSGTRKDELLLNEKERDCAFLVRRFITREEGVERLLDMLSKTETNEEFVTKVPAWVKLLEK